MTTSSPTTDPGRARSIEGRVTLVAGAGSGIGRATAALFAAEGATVVATDRDLSSVESLASDTPGDLTAGLLDVTRRDQIDEVMAGIDAAHGRLDVIVNNAGLAIGTDIGTEGFLEAWTTSLDVMLAGPMQVIDAGVGLLRRSDGGRIVNISSTEGVGGSAHASPYAAAKHGVIGLTRSLAVELGPEAITVNAVCPGPVRTGITEPIPEAMKTKFARRSVPLRRYAEPIEIAHAVLHLALPASSYITGHALLVDGGMTIKNN